MNIIFGDKKLQIKNRQEFQKIWESIQDSLNLRKEVISSIDLSGSIINREFQEILENHIQNPAIEARVNTIKMKELLRETQQTLKNHVLNILSNMEIVANPFYAELNQESWLNFEFILQALEWTNRVIEGLIRLDYEFDKTDFMETKCQMTIHLTAMLHALENKEYILVGDLLLYEFSPILEKLIDYTTIVLEEQDNEIQEK